MCGPSSGAPTVCGIVGIFRFDGRAVDRSEIERLNGSIVYRGPDEEGYFLENEVALSMRRLSIIDLSSGSQPMFSPDGRYVIVFNGEIYNYQELRAELEKTGYQFKTTSDTEVIIAGYATWGKKIVARMNGMWGFAIFDRKERKLFISRDRLGKKQLYYAITPQYFVVGSEMKIPMQYAPENRKIRLESLPEFLTYSYVGGPNTALSNVKLLPDAHSAEIDSKGTITVEPYWRIGDAKLPTPKNEKDAAEELYSILVDAVRLRLIADVPIAVMLSSGLDSSSLAYIIARELGHKLGTFSLGYSDEAFDESNDAGDLARRLDLPWHREVITGAEVRDCFPRFIGHIDSLQGNTAQLVYYFVSEMIRKAGFKVALNGSGGDELFAGY
ncbi:MAG: asparagine synthase (glutamine-hydrolyzing), partial [Deltaproteobacteria bacterium]|nr:asparagine synthase (glutamine-hydrolyzing) [Deltaproteobacteria bacterium]